MNSTVKTHFGPWEWARSCNHLHLWLEPAPPRGDRELRSSNRSTCWHRASHAGHGI